MAADFFKLLKKNSYPGRGIMIGLDNNANAIIAYFIMGRSDNSRNRVFTEKDGGIITEAADPAKMQDPSLIIYAPVRLTGYDTIVTNGDQTDTIYEYLAEGSTFENALRTRTFEPDAPNYTPRISGIVNGQDGISYKLSILKSCGGNPASAQRFFYEYAEPVKGMGHFVHTYGTDGEPLPSFCGEPRAVAIEEEFEDFSAKLWDSLNPDNKVSLFVRLIRPNGSFETRIFNRYEKV